MLPDDTIAAISTPPGRGGIGVIRLSGPAAFDIASAVFHSGRLSPQSSVLSPSKLEANRAQFGSIVDPTNGDVVVSLLYRNPVTNPAPFARVLRLTSSDGGRTASTPPTVLLDTARREG